MITPTTTSLQGKKPGIWSIPASRKPSICRAGGAQLVLTKEVGPVPIAAVSTI